MSIHETDLRAPGPPDWQLLAVIPGNQEAFEVFYRRYVDQIVRYCTSRLRDPEEVADAVANTFTAVLTSSASYDPDRGDAGAWLTGIAARMIASSFRQRQRQENLRLRVAGRRLLDSDDYDRLEEQIDASRTVDALASAIDSLSPRLREAILLVADAEMSPAEAAASIGVARPAFRMRLVAARRALRAALGEAQPAPPPRALPTINEPHTVTSL